MAEGSIFFVDRDTAVVVLFERVAAVAENRGVLREDDGDFIAVFRPSARRHRGMGGAVEGGAVFFQDVFCAFAAFLRAVCRDVVCVNVSTDGIVCEGIDKKEDGEEKDEGECDGEDECAFAVHLIV